MKLKPQTKKLLLLVGVLVVISMASGCSIPRNEDGSIVLITNETRFGEIFSNESWFSAILVYPLSWCINHLAPVIGVGAAITVVTVAINAILAVATFKSTLSTQRMQMLQPEMDKIQRKYEGRSDQNSQMRQAAELQALYRKYDVNPMSSILVMFLQIPVIFAIYMSVQRAETVAHGTFFGVSLSTTVLNGIKTLFAGDMSGIVYLLIFLVMAGLHILSVKINDIMLKRRQANQKGSKRVQNTQSDQMKVMQYYSMGMIIVFGLILPAAMSLYWAINSVVQVAKTILVQKAIENSDAQKNNKSRAKGK